MGAAWQGTAGLQEPRAAPGPLSARKQDLSPKPAGAEFCQQPHFLGGGRPPPPGLERDTAQVTPDLQPGTP